MKKIQEVGRDREPVEHKALHSMQIIRAVILIQKKDEESVSIVKFVGDIHTLFDMEGDNEFTSTDDEYSEEEEDGGIVRVQRVDSREDKTFSTPPETLLPSRPGTPLSLAESDSCLVCSDNPPGLMNSEDEDYTEILPINSEDEDFLDEISSFKFKELGFFQGRFF